MFYRSLRVDRSVQAMARGGKATTPACDYVYWRTIWDKLEVPTATSGATTTRPTACHLANRTFWVHGISIAQAQQQACDTNKRPPTSQAPSLLHEDPLHRSRPDSFTFNRSERFHWLTSTRLILALRFLESQALTTGQAHPRDFGDRQDCVLLVSAASGPTDILDL